MCVWLYMPLSVEVRGQLVWVCSLLPCGSCGLNSSGQQWWQRPPHWPWIIYYQTALNLFTCRVLSFGPFVYPSLIFMACWLFFFTWTFSRPYTLWWLGLRRAGKFYSCGDEKWRHLSSYGKGRDLLGRLIECTLGLKEKLKDLSLFTLLLLLEKESPYIAKTGLRLMTQPRLSLNLRSQVALT